MAAAAPEPTLTQKLIDWGLGFLRAMIGLLVLGWLLLKLTPDFMANTRNAMSGRTWASLGIGFIVFLVAVPIIGLLVGLAWLFWGFFPGALATALLLFGILGVIWFVSPALTGLCLGGVLLKNSGRLLQLFVGTLIILLLARGAEWIPVLGWFAAWLVLVVSFMFAVGAIILGLRTPPVAPAVSCACGDCARGDGAGDQQRGCRRRLTACKVSSLRAFALPVMRFTGRRKARKGIATLA